jgi:hypothetical protein
MINVYKLCLSSICKTWHVTQLVFLLSFTSIHTKNQISCFVIFSNIILKFMSQVINFLYFLFINVYFTPFLAFIYIFIHLLNSKVFNDTVQAYYCLYNVVSQATNENSKYILYIHSVLFSVIKRTIRNVFDVTGVDLTNQSRPLNPLIEWITVRNIQWSCQ